MNTKQYVKFSHRYHLQELTDRKHIAVAEACGQNPDEPDFKKVWFIEFLIEKYQDFIGVSRETTGF